MTIESHLADIAAVRAAVQAYVDGAGGDAALLETVFHPDAMMFGHRGENRRDMPIRDFIKYVREVGPSVVGPHYRAEIADIRVFGRAACATLVETDYAGHDFVDIFTLARIDGAWKIVSKTFTSEVAEARAR